MSYLIATSKGCFNAASLEEVAGLYPRGESLILILRCEKKPDGTHSLQQVEEDEPGYAEMAADLVGLWANEESQRAQNRPETGPMQFEGDWAGVFVRGDNAFGYLMALREALKGNDSPLITAQLEGLADLLAASNEMEKRPTQLLKTWKECQR
jgi:hypothetical protein